jgi:hypothetical protein
MSYFIGIMLALLSAGLAATVKFDRRTFYAMVLIASASYYVLFAVMADSMRAVMFESLFMTVFIALAVVGFKRSSWVLALGLCGHAVLDLVHGRIVSNPGVPASWPSFCMSYDVIVALALLVLRTRAAGPNLRLGLAAGQPPTSALP